MDFLNRLFNFLFISSKVNTLKFFHHPDKYKNYNPYRYKRIPKELFDELEIANTIYKKQIRRYLGLGFFLSFFPGTEIYLARKALFSVIGTADLEMQKNPTLGSSVITSPFHVFSHTLGEVMDGVESDFFKILRRKAKAELNRLNPFLYITKLIWFIAFSLHDHISYLINFITLPIVIFFMFLQFVAELILNSLYTLLIEPFLFGYEVIEQLVTDWQKELEYASIPTEDYFKINRMLYALDNKDFNFINTYSTKELTLIQATEEEISSYKKHQESPCFKMYKNIGLFYTNHIYKDHEKNASSYRLLEGLFLFFAHKKLPTDAIQYTARIGSELARFDLKADDNAENEVLLKFKR